MAGKLKRLVRTMLTPPGARPGETPKEYRERLKRARAQGKGIKKKWYQ